MTAPGPIGFKLNSDEALNADIQNLVDHVLHKESGQTSKFTSFSTSLKSVQKFTKAKGNRKVTKAQLEKLRQLEEMGEIIIIDPDRASEIARNLPKRKLAKKANDVKQVMLANKEIIIEGQIPEEFLKNVN